MDQPTPSLASQLSPDPAETQPDAMDSQPHADTPQDDITPEVDTAQVIADLAKLSPIDYDRVRVDAASNLGIQVKTLDAEVKAARAKIETPSTLPFQEVEPCDTEVDPAELLDELVATIRRYLVLEPEQAHALALWIVLTWLTDSVEILALLIITAPERSCGKTLALLVCSYLVARALSASNSTSSFLFRAIANWNATICLMKRTRLSKGMMTSRGSLTLAIPAPRRLLDEQLRWEIHMNLVCSQYGGRRRWLGSGWRSICRTPR